MVELKKYTSWLKRKDLAPNTINNYLQTIRLFGKKPLTTTNLREYIHQNLSNYQASTWYTKIKALTVYARYKKIKVRWERILKIIPKFQKKFFPTITSEELEQLKKARFEENNWVFERNNLILDFLFFTGLRVSELVNIKLADYQHGSLKVLGKGNKVRFVFIADFLINKLANPYSSQYLFTNQQGRKLSRMLINYIIQTRTKLTGINKVISPHTFRRSFATLLYNRCGKLTTVQKLLGHSTIETTAQYIHNDYETLYADYSKLWKNELTINDYAN